MGSVLFNLQPIQENMVREINALTSGKRRHSRLRALVSGLNQKVSVSAGRGL